MALSVFGQKIYLDELEPQPQDKNRKFLGKKDLEAYIRKHRGGGAYRRIWQQVLMKYIDDNNLHVVGDELQAIVKHVEDRLAGDPALAQMPVDRAQDPASSRRMRRNLLTSQSRWNTLSWKVCRRLHKKYGGRVGISSFGPITAWDGQNKLIEQHIRAGEIIFHRPEVERDFRSYTKIEHFSDAYPKGDQLTELLAKPPYEWPRG